jgi:site-specific DNA-methyltransferase (adenine-specific)
MFRREDLAEGVTLYCGDCREVMPTLGHIDVVVTDPPYGMAFRSNYRAVRHDAIANDSSDDLLQWICSQPVRHSKYVFCRWDNLANVPQPRSVVNWIKNNWSMGDLDHEHARQTEIALFYPGEQHFFPVGRPTDVLEVRRTGNDYHPSEKPTDLMWAIVRWTAGTVVDPFMGSGTTGVACAKLGRQFVGIEIEPRYFDVACRRISDALARPDLFIASPKPIEKQEVLL